MNTSPERKFETPEARAEWLKAFPRTDTPAPFAIGDVVASRSGVFYVVVGTYYLQTEGTLAIVPVRGGSQRTIKAAAATLKTEEDLRQVTAPGFQEAWEAMVSSVLKNKADLERREAMGLSRP